MFKRSVLKSGLQIITTPNNNSAFSCVCGVLKSGSRYENPEVAGISHVLEHMCLKGTNKWPNKVSLMTVIEKIGGITNGQTRKESTTFWIKIRNEHINKALKIILDIILNPKLDNISLEREKIGVLAQIDRRNDSPEQHIWDIFFKTAWPSHPLGQETLGNSATIKKISIQDLIKYKSRRFIPQNSVISIYGNIDHIAVTELVSKNLHHLGTPITEQPDIFVQKDQDKPNFTISFKEIRQLYLLFGIKTFSESHPDKYTLQVLNSVLGSGFSSRLYLGIREEQNLAFSPRSTILLFQDTGLLAVQAEVDKNKIDQAILSLIRELNRLKTEEVPFEELEMAKEKLKSRILSGLETSEKIAEWYGIQALFRSKITTVEEMFDQIDRVNPLGIKRVATELFIDKNLNLAITGHLERVDYLKDKLSFDCS